MKSIHPATIPEWENRNDRVAASGPAPWESIMVSRKFSRRLTGCVAVSALVLALNAAAAPAAPPQGKRSAL
jgi:hypothetical protein